MEWSEDQTETLWFADLFEPCLAMVKQCYPGTNFSKRRNKERLKWKGPSRSYDACIPDHSWSMSEDGMDQNEFNHGRNPLEAILMTAIQLGITQGQRMMRREMMDQLELLSMQLTRSTDGTGIYTRA